MVVFSIFLISLLLLIIIFVFSTIKINVDNLTVSNIDKIKIQYDYVVNIKFYILGIIKFFQLKIDKDKVKKNKMLMNMDLSKIKENFRKIKIEFKDLNLEVEAIDLKLEIGTDSVMLTSLLVLLISTILSIVLQRTIKEINPKKHEYKIQALYLSKNVIDLKFNCIIKLKMVHIINMIYTAIKKRRWIENARTSDRGVNDDCNEQYTRYGRCKYNYRRANRNI